MDVTALAADGHEKQPEQGTNEHEPSNAEAMEAPFEHNHYEIHKKSH